MINTKNVRPVLIMVDNRTRDAEGILLIYYWLKDLGYPVVLSNQSNWADKCFIYNPSVVVLSNAITAMASPRGDFITFLSKYAKIVLLTQEGAVPKKEDTINLYLGKLTGEMGSSRSGELAKVFLWGSQTYRWLDEAGVFKPSQMIVAGTPRFDAFLITESMNTSGKAVGFATSHTHINAYHGTGLSNNFLSQIYSRRDYKNGLDAYYGKGRHWEDWIWYNVATFRYECELIERCASELKGTKISIRPGPFELVEGYDFFKKRYAYLESRNDLFLSEWVKNVFCMVDYVSTAGIAALACGVPVISPTKLLGDRLYDHMMLEQFTDPYFLKFFWLPKNLDETLDMIKAAKAGKLPPVPPEHASECSKYLKDYYDFPRTEPSSLTIAKELGQLAEDGTRYLEPVLEPGIFNHIYRRSRVLLKYPYYVGASIKRRTFKSMQRYHLYRWHYGDFMRSKAVWKRLKAKYSGDGHT